MLGSTRAQVWLLVAGSAAAQVPTPSVDYQVAPDCPDEAWFLERLAEQQVAPTSGALLLTVEPSEEGFRALASLSDVIPPTNGTWQRLLVDDDCETLLHAVVLSLALHLEHETRTDAEPGPVPAPILTAPTPTARLAANDVAPEVESERRVRLLLGLGGGLQTGLSPQWEPVAAIRVGIGGDGDHFGAGRYQMTFSAVPGDVRQGEVATEMETIPWSSSWWALGLHVCPWGIRLTSFVVSACGDARLIRYRVELFRSPTRSTTWVGTAGPVVAATLDLGPLGVQLDTGLDIPLAPADTEFQQRSVYRQKAGMHALVLTEVYPLSGF